MLNRINTNDILQVRRPHKAISSDMYVMCGANSESVYRLFLHCSVANFLWNTLFGIFGAGWVCPATLDQFLLTSFVGFGRRKETKSLWPCAIYATIWSIWLEHNSRTFNHRFSSKQVLWDRVRSLASIWCKAHDLFTGISLSHVERLKSYASLIFFSFVCFVLVRRISCPPIFLYHFSLLNIFFFYLIYI